MSLIVDDTADITRFLGMTLESAGYTVSVANDGAEGLELIRRESPDVVLLDLMMPVVDGWTVLSRVRTWDDGSPPIIVLSAVGSRNEQLLARMMGALDYVTKPFDVSDLLERLSLAITLTTVESA
jgi:two-component system response regulator ResD